MSDIHSVIKMIMNYMVNNNNSSKEKIIYSNNKINSSKSDSDLFAKIQINGSLERKYNNSDLNVMYSKFKNRKP